jgi:hypothetical protein
VTLDEDTDGATARGSSPEFARSTLKAFPFEHSAMYVDPDPECDEGGWGAARSTAVPVAAVVAVAGAFAAIYGVERSLTYPELLGVAGQFAVMATVVVGHEAIHAVSYAALAGLSREEIAVEVGLFPDDSLDPVHFSVHPVVPVRRNAYAAGVAAPGLLIGVLPSVVALATGSSVALFVGLVGLLLVATDVAALVDLWRRPETVAAPDPAST